MYKHANGSVYEGHWKNDSQEGSGKEMWTDGSRFDGLYREGKKNGKGTY